MPWKYFICDLTNWHIEGHKGMMKYFKKKGPNHDFRKGLNYRRR